MNPRRVSIRRAIPSDSRAIAGVYLAPFAAALPTIRLAHADDAVRAGVRDHVVPDLETWVADDDGRVVALMVLAPG